MAAPGAAPRRIVGGKDDFPTGRAGRNAETCSNGGCLVVVGEAWVKQLGKLSGVETPDRFGRHPHPGVDPFNRRFELCAGADLDRPGRNQPRHIAFDRHDTGHVLT